MFLLLRIEGRPTLTKEPKEPEDICSDLHRPATELTTVSAEFDLDQTKTVSKG
jgi:hypothetical protein